MGRQTAVRSEGTIRRIVADKGFGFIAADGSRQEFFFHLSSCTAVEFTSLREGQRVTFEPTMGQKGPRAEQVAPVDDGAW